MDTNQAEEFDTIIESLKKDFEKNPAETLKHLKLYTHRKWEALGEIRKKEKEEIEKNKISLLKKIKSQKAGSPLNLVEFYNDNVRDQPLGIGDDFSIVLKQALTDEIHAPVEPDEMWVFKTRERYPETPDYVCDLCTLEGRMEVRKRLGFIAYLLKKQPQGQDGQLQTDGGIVFGWVKLLDGTIRILVLRGFFMEDDPQWNLDAEDENEGYPYGAWYLSRSQDAFN